MKYETIPFETLKQEFLRTFFPQVKEWKYAIGPDEIYHLAKQAGMAIEYHHIPNWLDFERSFGPEVYISDAEFLALLFDKANPLEGPIDILTHTHHWEAYRIDYSNLELFIADVYPELNQEDFFQPLDTVFFSFNDCYISMIHHEGYYIKLERSKKE